MEAAALGLLDCPRGVDVVTLLAELNNPRTRVDDVEKPHCFQCRYRTAHPHRLKQSCALMRGCLKRERVLYGLPHPSRENSERVAYFLGEKARSDLSVKTNADKLDAARDGLQRAVASLC